MSDIMAPWVVHETEEREGNEQYLVAEEDDIEQLLQESEERAKSSPGNLQPIVWKNVVKFTLLHLAAVYGLHLAVFYAKWTTLLFAFLLFCISQFGVTAGAHRLWTHRSYKAALPARILLAFFNTFTFQNDVIEWARDHRCHHKWTDTDADPHNARRGLFYSHIGWLLVRKHPEVIRRGRTLDLSDLTGDPVLVFQRRFYVPLVLFNGFVLTTLLPVKLWHESPFVAFFVAGMLRYVASLNVTFCINSFAHFVGYKPYDAKISPTENVLASLSTLGEGGHNYHHSFPQDYRTSEFGYYANWTTALIDLFAAIGWVTERKTASQEMITRQVLKHGNPALHVH